MATGESDTAFGVEQMELSMIVVGAILAAAFSWIANDATGTIGVVLATFTGVVAFVVAVVLVRQSNG